MDGEKTAQKLLTEFGSIENLLEHTDQLKGALKTKVETNRKMIEFSKFLATIKIDVPITLNMDELKREEPDEEELRKIFEEMEFRTLIDRVFNREKKTASAGATSMSHNKAQGSLFGDQPSLFDQPSTSPSSQASSQGNLFAEFEDENTENGNYSNLACLENSKYDYQLIDTEEKRKESWSQEDDAYFIYGYQKYEDIPIFHEMMSIARVMAYDTPDNAPIQAIYSTRGIEKLDISGVYEFEKGKQQVTLKPFEDIAAVVEEKFENILNDADYEVTRAKFYERVYLDEKQKYKADPIWYFEVVENNISKSVTLINAETGKEIFLQ